MKNLIKAELIKVRTTRTALALLAGMLTFIAIIVVSELGNSPEEWRSIPLVSQSFFVGAGSIMWLFVLVLGLRSFTDEFRHGSIVPTLLTNPDRCRVLGAKLVAVAMVSLLFVAAAYGLAMAIGVPRMISAGAHPDVLSGAMSVLLGKAALSGLLWAGIGVGLGLAVKHQVAAIVGSFVWIMIIESLVEGPLPKVAKFLPVHASIGLNGFHGNVTLATLAAAAAFAGWALAAVGAGAILFQRRDIA
jgi:ABC-2 type transport system permease protein